MRTPVLAALAVLVACGSSSSKSNDPPEPEAISECDAYVASFSACMRSLGPALRATTDERVRALRASLVPPKEEPAREAMRQRCAQGVNSLRGRCQ